MASRLQVIFDLYINNQANSEEISELVDFYADPLNEEEFNELLTAQWHEFKARTPVFSQMESEKILINIFNKEISVRKSPRHALNYRLAYKIAAAILLILATGVLFIRSPIDKQSLTVLSSAKISRQAVKDAHSVNDKAILTLSDGTVVNLTAVAPGNIKNQSGTRITKTSEGQLVFSIGSARLASKAGKSRKPEYNTISTPNGGQYQINLPDGTKVWLNAASSLKFPTDFTLADRKVELSGEGYFEVAKVKVHEKRTPFKVFSHTEFGRSQEITVLGTHFNIQAYNNDKSFKTSLLEGSVVVRNLNSNAIHLLRPGEQSVLTADKDVITAVNVEEVLAWKNGQFVFDNTPLLDILRQLERWYDVEIDYNKVPDTRYQGVISKKQSLSQVLNMLELTGNLRFKINKLAGEQRLKVEIDEK
jgi:transmembrane sensor